MQVVLIEIIHLRFVPRAIILVLVIAPEVVFRPHQENHQRMLLHLQIQLEKTVGGVDAFLRGRVREGAGQIVGPVGFNKVDARFVEPQRLLPKNTLIQRAVMPQDGNRLFVPPLRVAGAKPGFVLHPHQVVRVERDLEMAGIDLHHHGRRVLRFPSVTVMELAPVSGSGSSRCATPDGSVGIPLPSLCHSLGHED